MSVVHWVSYFKSDTRAARAVSNLTRAVSKIELREFTHQIHYPELFHLTPAHPPCYA